MVYRMLALTVLSAALVVGCSFSFGPTSTPVPPPRPTARPVVTQDPFSPAGISPLGPTEIGTVTFVIDGDTVLVQMGNGEEVTVRYIGIDAPERETEELWLESTELNQDLVDGREVFLEKDVSDTDQFGRLLRHVWIPDEFGWRLINAEIVRLGMADAKTYPPDTLWDSEYMAAESEARASSAGIWGLR
jgi:micrococcal nuclease